MENVDKTIDAICTQIQLEISKNPFVTQCDELPKWINALAALVAARGNATLVEFES